MAVEITNAKPVAYNGDGGSNNKVISHSVLSAQGVIIDLIAPFWLKIIMQISNAEITIPENQITSLVFGNAGPGPVSALVLRPKSNLRSIR